MDEAINIITVYYYTAWDGFSWQGCDEATAKSLQGYLEATGTLPESSAQRPPFGGAVACKINGKVGVAVYRYHTREKGDISGRDSLYIALAFVPLEFGCIDFAKVLECSQLAATKSGALSPESLKISKHEIALEDDGMTSPAWMDGELEDGFRELSGRGGLQTLSRLFFSEHAQLGFLNAVFSSASGVDEIVSVQTYRVYREVSLVVAASEQYEIANEQAGGELPRNDKAVVGFKSALEALDKWATKAGYAGLRKYYEEKRAGLDDKAGRLKKVADYIRELNRLYAPVKNAAESGVFAAHGVDAGLRTACDKCIDKAKSILSLPAFDDEQYKRAVALALDAIDRSSIVIGYNQGARRVREERKSEIEELRSQLEKARQETKLAQQAAAKKNDTMKALATISQPSQGYGAALINGGAVAGTQSQVKHRSYGSIVDWTLYGLIVATVVVVAVVLTYMIASGKPSKPPRVGPSEPGQFTPTTGTNIVDDVVSDATSKTQKVATVVKPVKAQEELDPTTETAGAKESEQVEEPTSTNEFAKADSAVSATKKSGGKEVAK